MSIQAINHLLVVDDDELAALTIAPVVAQVPEIAHYHIEPGGWEALDYLANCMAHQEFPNLILLDLNMPGMHGFDFVEHYERKFYNQHLNTAIIVFSNSTLKKDRQKALQFKSVKAYLNKPLSGNKLKDVLNPALIQ